MATIIQFNPQPVSIFQFSPVLDGVTYSATVTWNLYGQRYYLNIYTVDGVLQLSVPLIGSPDAGFVVKTQEVTSVVNMVASILIGESKFYPSTSVDVNDLISGMVVSGDGVSPDTLYLSYGFDEFGFYINVSEPFIDSIENNPLTLTFTNRLSLYAPADDPAASDINLTQGYFNTPIIFRSSSNNFEIG